MTTRDVLIGVLSTVAAAVTCAAHPAPGMPPAQRAVGWEMLVFPFENANRAAKLDWLGEGLSELTIERLLRAGQGVFPREERLEALEKLGLPASSHFSRATMLKIAEEIDADYVVFGQFSSEGTNLTLTAQVLRVDPPHLSPAITESGALEDLMDMHSRLAWRLMTAIDPGYHLSERQFFAQAPRLRLDAFEHYIRGLRSSAQGNDDQRLRDLREAARLEPAWDDPAFALGEIYFLRRDWASALPWFSRIPLTHERGLEAAFAAGVCQLQRGDAAHAETAFTTLVERMASPGSAKAGASSSASPELPEAFNNLGIARTHQGKAREAVAAFERATRADSEDEDYWFNLGVARLQAGDSTAAVSALREALRVQPDDAKTRALLLAALERSGKSAEAAGERDALARLGESQPVLPPLTGEELTRLQRVKMRLDPGWLHPYVEPTAPTATNAASSRSSRQTHRLQHSQFHVTRGRDFLTAGKLDDAQHEFLVAISLAPLWSAAAHQGLAEVYRREGRADDAIRELRAALIGRDDAAVHIELARIYISQRRSEEARSELQEALKQNPTPKLRDDARQLLEQLDRSTSSVKPLGETR